MLYCMSATELLRQVKTLPARERHKFMLAVLNLAEEKAPRAKTHVRSVKWPDVETRAKRLFGDRVLPNLVLLEREQATF